MADTMDIRTPVGARVIFLGNGGYPAQREFARSVLTVGAEYTIQDDKIGNWETSVWLDGIQHSFNSVMFANVPEPSNG